MKKYIIILLSVIVIIWGTISIKNQYLLKNAFVFSDKDIVSTILLMDKPEPDNYNYQISKDLANNISKALSNSKKQRISGDKFSNNYSPKGIEMFLDGEKKITKDDASITFKRRITLIKEENNDIHVSIDINDIKNDNMINLLTRNYVVQSKALASYIDALYK